jgi:hypothetical protein
MVTDCKFQTLELNIKAAQTQGFSLPNIARGIFLARSASRSSISLIYLLHGLSVHFDNWTGKTSFVKYFAAMNLSP